MGARRAQTQCACVDAAARTCNKTPLFHARRRIRLRLITSRAPARARSVPAQSTTGTRRRSGTASEPTASASGARRLRRQPLLSSWPRACRSTPLTPRRRRRRCCGRSGGGRPGGARGRREVATAAARQGGRGRVIGARATRKSRATGRHGRRLLQGQGLGPPGTWKQGAGSGTTASGGPTARPRDQRRTRCLRNPT